MSDTLIYWICHECGIVFSKKCGEGFKCPSGHSIYEVEGLNDDQEELYKIGLKEGERRGAIAELTKLNNAFFDSDSGKHIKIYVEKRLKELK